MFQCLCDCGKMVEVRASDLRRGHTRSCGCAQAAATRTHGAHESYTYQSWRAMRKRCYDPKNVSYPSHGGRGIQVCAEWNDPRTGYAAFVRDMGERPKGMTLDRRDVNGDYTVTNCRWATALTQTWNKRNTVQIREENEEMAYWQQQEEEAYAQGDIER